MNDSRQPSSQVSGHVDRNTLAGKVSCQVPNELDLLFDGEPTGDRLKNGADCNPIFADQAGVIDVGEDAHQKLAVHSICHPPMSRDAMTKIFDVKGSLESGGEEATEWTNKGGKSCHDEQMQVVGRIRERQDVPPQYPSQEDPEGGPDFPLPPNKNRIGVALDVTPGVHAEVRDRADHILPSHKQRPPDNSKEHGAEECTNETFDGLFR